MLLTLLQELTPNRSLLVGLLSVVMVAAVVLRWRISLAVHKVGRARVGAHPLARIGGLVMLGMLALGTALILSNWH
jgi:hypothetical protein